MHIMEGFLPVEHALGWSVASAPFVASGPYSIKKRSARASGAAHAARRRRRVFLRLSALKLPSVTGSCSHPTGTGLGALLFGRRRWRRSAWSSCSSRRCCSRTAG
jgi:cobalt/nickel transport system permease protein